MRKDERAGGAEDFGEVMEILGMKIVVRRVTENEVEGVFLGEEILDGGF